MTILERLYEKAQSWFESRHEQLEIQAKTSWLVRYLGLSLFHTLWFYTLILLSPLGWIFLIILLLLGVWQVFGIHPPS